MPKLLWKIKKNILQKLKLQIPKPFLLLLPTHSPQLYSLLFSAVRVHDLPEIFLPKATKILIAHSMVTIVPNIHTAISPITVFYFTGVLLGTQPCQLYHWFWTKVGLPRPNRLGRLRRNLEFPSNLQVRVILSTQQKCRGSGIIYSGSGSSFEFLEFRIRIQAKVPDPCGSGSDPYYLSTFGNSKKTP